MLNSRPWPTAAGSPLIGAERLQRASLRGAATPSPEPPRRASRLTSSLRRRGGSSHGATSGPRLCTSVARSGARGARSAAASPALRGHVSHLKGLPRRFARRRRGGSGSRPDDARPAGQGATANDQVTAPRCVRPARAAARQTLLDERTCRRAEDSGGASLAANDRTTRGRLGPPLAHREVGRQLTAVAVGRAASLASSRNRPPSTASARIIRPIPVSRARPRRRCRTPRAAPPCSSC